MAAMNGVDESTLMDGCASRRGVRRAAVTRCAAGIRSARSSRRRGAFPRRPSRLVARSPAMSPPERAAFRP